MCACVKRTLTVLPATQLIFSSAFEFSAQNPRHNNKQQTAERRKAKEGGGGGEEETKNYDVRQKNRDLIHLFLSTFFSDHTSSPGAVW